MKNVPKIKLSDITPEKLSGIKDGYKIYDTETNKYYEKVNGMFQEMVEEEAEVKPVADYSATKDAIDDMVAKGDKLRAANFLMNLKTTRKQLESQKDMVNQKINFMFTGTPEQIDLIQARVSEVTEEAIKKAKIEDLKQFFIFDDKEVALNYDDMLPDKDKREAYREFLLYLKSIADADGEINKEISKIDDLITHFDPDMVEKSNDVYVWDDYIYNLFNERLNDPNTDDKEKARIQRIIDVRESAFTLTPIIDSLKAEIAQGKRSSMMYAFRNRFTDTLKKAERYARENGFNIYFHMVDDIEGQIGLTEWRNIFIYLFARYIKFNYNHLSKIDNAFIAQVIENLIMLKKNQLKEPGRTKFVNAIKEIVNILSET